MLRHDEGRAARFVRARAARRCERTRRGTGDRAEAGTRLRPRSCQRACPGPSSSAQRRRTNRACDDTGQGRSGRPLRPAALDRAPARRGRAPAPPRNQDRDRAADRRRLLLRLRVPGADLGGRSLRDRSRDAARDRGGAHLESRGGPTRGRARALPRGVPALQGRARERGRASHLAVHAGRLHRSKALRLTGLAGAYWRGDERNTQLTRIYGTAFYSQADLDAHLQRLEQARAKDHRRLGPQLDLFHFDEHSPGAALWHPKGVALFNALEDLRRCENAKRGYLEVRTPLMWDIELWKRSGHWEKYHDALFLIPHGEHTFGLKPMNCPGHMLLFASKLRSYRELPIRYAESASLHRDEPTGTLHGLLRVRQMHQDDSHVFCTEEQIQDEIDGMFEFVGFLYDRLGVRELAHAELSTRPESKLGTDEQWDYTEGVLGTALERQGIPYRVKEGDGAFYGPKIDLFMDDAMGRPWQMGTIQLDGQQPARLGCKYTGADNREHMPWVIHRALFGSLERFIGILVEHYAGDFPFWLAPVQARVLPVGEGHRGPADSLRYRLAAAGYRADVDDRDETLGKRIRDAELEKIPFVLVYGDRESDDALAVRERGGGQSTRSLSELLDSFDALAAEAGAA
ncbi:MAG: threonine--tRNA ligase [Actinobacteria bacterium]|nr:MAG: threonine--tRNA ligase [Actinomycetota bacterium]